MKNNSFKRVIAVLLSVIILTAMLCGCGSQQAESESAAAADTDILLHVHNSLPYTTLDPSVEYSNGILTLQQVYETLTHYNSETTEVEPMIATEWSSNEDATVWIFKLREDITFHDGCKLTSADVKASIERTIALGQGAAYNWDCVDTIECPSDYEVVFNLQYSAPLDLVASAGYAAYIMDKDVCDKDTEWFNEGNDAGSGPYMIKSASPTQVVFTAYEGYYGGWADDQYKTVVVQEVEESSARRQMLETGEAQVSTNFSSTDLEALETQTDKVSILKAQTFTNAMAFLNSQSYPCNDVNFRKCLQYAFPYTDAVEGVLNGNAAYSVGLVTAGLWGHDDTLTTYTFDMDKAAEALAASDVDVSEGIELRVTYMSGDPNYDNILQIWQSNLKPLGINLSLNAMEWDAQWAEGQAVQPEDRQDVFMMLWWPDYASPSSWFDSLIKSEEEPYYNLAYINDPEIDELIDTADKLAATDREASAATYIEIQKKLIEDAYIINMYDQENTYVVSNTITVDGVIENPAYTTAVPYYNIHKAG